MSSQRDSRAPDHRVQSYDRDGRMYDDDHYDRQGERATTWPRPNLPHDPGRTPPQPGLHWDTRAMDRDYRRNPLANGQGIQIRGRAGNAADRASPEHNARDDDDYKIAQQDRRGTSRNRTKDRSRSYSPNRRPRSPNYGGAPSKEVMLDGLPSGLSEEDISYNLKTEYRIEGLEDVRIIRDRRNGESRGFGFIRFHNLPAARAFVESNYPCVSINARQSSGAGSQGARIRIAYSREREDRARPSEANGDWTCAVCSTLNFAGRELCFKCNSPPIDMAAFQQQARQQEYMNSGDSDAAIQGPPSQFLLLRGLEPNVTEELLAKGVSKLLKPAQETAQPAKKNKVSSTTTDANLGAREGSIRRVFVVRDRQTNESWRYGFAEFATVDDAQAALARFISFDRFTISSKPVSVSYIHAGVFVPVFEAIEDHLVFSPLGNPATKLRYWNEHAFVSELLVSEPEYDSAAVEAERARQATDVAAAAAHKEGLVPVREDQDAKGKKRKIEPKEKDVQKNKKATAAHLQFWSNRHAELHGIKSTDAKGGANDAESLSPPKATRGSAEPPQMSYADPNKICCYLCARQFKSVTEVNKHERLSQLHRDNLRNEELKKKATAKLEKAGLPTTSMPSGEDDGSEYRDRASERRRAFGASKKLSLPMKKQPAATSPPRDTNSSSASTAQPSSKGAALLGKMGWSTGEGLGARGEGAKEAIATNVYAAGVGLGAEGGKLGDAVEEASRNSKGDYEEFVQKAKDKAKARYESMA